MVWSKKFFADINDENQEVLKRFQSTQPIPENAFKVGIVGGGPKGIYAIERIASLWANYSNTSQLEITCFNTDDSFGAGNNYNTNQPDYLLINYSLGNINFWIDEPIQLVQERPDLVNFINRYKVGTDEIAQPLNFCSRSIAGIYIQYCFSKVLETLPSNISVCLCSENVLEVEKFKDSFEVITAENTYSNFSELLFCTGHAYKFSDLQTKKNNAFSETTQNTVFVPHIYPVEKLHNKSIRSKTILVQGLGLTFVDAALALTEGLGGKFQLIENRLKYLPSGKEPKVIYPYSRTGLPMLARKAGLKETLVLRYFNKRFVDRIFEDKTQIDFEEDLLPILILEYRYQFVNKFLQIVGYSTQFDKKRLPLNELEKLVRIIFPEFKPFDFWDFIDPKNDTVNQHEYVLSYLNNSVYPGSRPFQQALNAMTGIWRAIHPLFNKLYRFGKLKGESQQKFDTFYFGRLSRVSYGPPLENMKKILALAEAGLLDFTFSKNPDIHTNVASEVYSVSTPNGKETEADVLIDARIAKATGKDSLPEVYKKLMDRYNVSQFSNETYQTGSLALDKQATVINLPGITLSGTPTEGWTLDNESLSRNNNNFISPWANRLVEKYAIKASKIKALNSLVD